MKKPDLDEYLRLAVRALPDTAETAQRLSETLAILQTAQAALHDGQPDSTGRIDAALTMALGSLKLLGDQFAQAAEWVNSTVTPEGQSSRES